MPTEPLDPAAIAALPPPIPRFGKLVGSLTITNMVVVLTGLVTGPLQAHALGPAGRGTLAAILVPIALAPAVASLGFGAYAAREAARGRRPGEVIGSVGACYLVVGALVVAASWPIAAWVADGRPTVELCVLAGLWLVPLSLLGGLLAAVTAGLDRWTPVIAARIVPPVVALLAVVVLYVTATLTVTSAAIVAITGGLLALIPLYPVVRHGGRLRVRRELVRECVPFGLKASLGVLASLANFRLDQLLMIRLVSPHELGLYVVAATIGTLSGALTTAVSSVLFVRVAEGDTFFTQRALRTCIALVLAVGVLLAAVTPFVLRYAFGSDFVAAKGMVWILLGASVPLAGVTVLSAALTGNNRPALPSYAELVTLAVTISGLVLFLPAYGAIGAAWVSLAAYSLSSTLLLVATRRTLGGRFADYLLVRPADIRWGITTVSRALPSFPVRRP